MSYSNYNSYLANRAICCFKIWMRLLPCIPIAAR